MSPIISSRYVLNITGDKTLISDLFHNHAISVDHKRLFKNAC